MIGLIINIHKIRPGSDVNRTAGAGGKGNRGSYDLIFLTNTEGKQ
jgi:hypothetical protein